MKRSIFIFIILLLISGCNDINVNKEDEIKYENDHLIEEKAKGDNSINNDDINKEQEQNIREKEVEAGNETENNELNEVTKDDNLDFANFIVDKLVNSLRDENYDNLIHLYIFPKYGDQDVNSIEMIVELLKNYKSKFDIETVTYEYTGEIINYKDAKAINYYKFKLYDNYGNQHHVEVGVTSYLAIIKDSMFNPK